MSFSFNPITGNLDKVNPPVDISGKQDTLVSGTNIKTINGGSVLGSGDITISGGSSVNGYEYQNYEKTSTYVYVGYEHADGKWYIYRRTIADNTRQYASGSSGYNWSNRASETYS